MLPCLEVHAVRIIEAELIGELLRIEERERVSSGCLGLLGGDPCGLQSRLDPPRDDCPIRVTAEQSAKITHRIRAPVTDRGIEEEILDDVLGLLAAEGKPSRDSARSGRLRKLFHLCPQRAE